MWTMAPPRNVELTPHTFIGVSLALLGVVLTLDNLGFVEAQEVLRFWPVVPILVGGVYVVQGHALRDWLVGTGWMAVGTAFLLRNLDVFHFDLVDFLPLLLVGIGLRFMFGRRRPNTPGPAQPSPPPGVSSNAPATPWSSGQSHVLRVFAILYGVDRRHRGALAHVEVSAVMGGCDIDLREATPSSDPLVVQVFAMWGGIDIRVPAGWLIQNEAWPILGGVVDNTTTPAVSTHRVIVRGNAFMGGVEIKN